MKLRGPRIFCFVSLSFALLACSREASVMSSRAAHEPVTLARLEVERLGSDSDTTRAILGMSFDEVARRLTSLVFDIESSFVFNRGGEELEQHHRAQVAQDASGNFRVEVSTGQSQVALYLIGDDVFVRQDTGNLRKRPRREANTDVWRELLWSSMQQSLALYSGALRLIEPRHETVAGRAAKSWRLALARGAEEGVTVPLVIAPGLHLSPVARWRELARPLAVKGNIVVDEATGVVLKLALEGRMEIADRDVRPTQLTLRVEGAVSSPNAVAAIRAPRSVDEYERKAPVSDPIAFIRRELVAAGAEVLINPAAIPAVEVQADNP